MSSRYLRQKNMQQARIPPDLPNHRFLVEVPGISTSPLVYLGMSLGTSVQFVGMVTSASIACSVIASIVSDWEVPIGRDPRKKRTVVDSSKSTALSFSTVLPSGPPDCLLK